jgi:hypothetical protein
VGRHTHCCRAVNCIQDVGSRGLVLIHDQVHKAAGGQCSYIPGCIHLNDQIPLEHAVRWTHYCPLPKSCQ